MGAGLCAPSLLSTFCVALVVCWQVAMAVNIANLDSTITDTGALANRGSSRSTEIVRQVSPARSYSLVRPET